MFAFYRIFIAFNDCLSIINNSYNYANLVFILLIQSSRKTNKNELYKEQRTKNIELSLHAISGCPPMRCIFRVVHTFFTLDIDMIRPNKLFSLLCISRKGMSNYGV